MILLGCAWFAAAGDARAEEPRVALALNWIRLPGAENCIDPAELARTVEQQMGRSVFVSPTAATRVIEGWSEPTNPGWRAVLRSSDAEGNASGQRELTSASETCSSLNRFIVLAVSLMAQSASGVPHEAPEKVAKVARPAGPPLFAETPADRTTRQRVSPLSVGQAELGPAFSVGWGVLPNTAMGLGLRASIALSSAWVAELSSTIWIPQPADGWWAVSLSRADVALGLCPVLAEGTDVRVRVSACAGLAISALQASGPLAVAPQALVLGSYGRLVGSVGISPLVWITGAASVGVPFNPMAFSYAYGDRPGAPPPVWSMPSVTASGEIGVMLHFGP